jgi:hypothetical protein
VDFEVARPVVIQGMTVIPVGAVSWGAVQSVKKGKFIRFDIEGVQLPDGTNVKLRSVGARARNPGQDQIKVDSSFEGGVGAAKGSEYTAYVDEDREVAVSRQARNRALAAARTAPPTPAQVAAPSALAVTRAVTSTTPAAPATSPAVSPPPSAAPLANMERVTVECFSDPSGADILIDGDFYGNTPSILKIPVGRHDLQIQLSGYKTYAIPMILQSGARIRRVRASLEQKE